MMSCRLGRSPCFRAAVKLVGLIDACHSDTGFRSLPNSARQWRVVLARRI